LLLVRAFLVRTAKAATPADLGKNLDAARENMLKMLDATDAGVRDAAYLEMKKATVALDSALAEIAASASDAQTAKLREFKSTWEAFKATRDADLVPAALSGDAEKVKQAKEKAGAVQTERFAKMKQLIADLGK
jgi:methylphosphotriester-DNA--protein-cysteine methyltransferase